jgi:hypothetical protein
MKRHRKILLAVFLAAVVLAGSIGGAVLASDGNEESATKPEFGSYIERVIELYQKKTNTTIDREALQDSFSQAREEMREAQPRLRFHGRLFDDEALTQEQRDEIEAWLEARPEFPTEEFKEWLESKPDLLPDDFKEWLESRPDFLEDGMSAWFDICPETMPFKFGEFGKFGHNSFGMIKRFGDRSMFGFYQCPEDN